MALCECGCGHDAGIYASDGGDNRHRKGDPKRYVNGHNRARLGTGKPVSARYTVEDRGYTTPCWIFTMSTHKRGYGRMWDATREKLVPAHRYFYEIFVGPIPDGLQIDHLCRVRNCVNPDHLEPTTNTENNHRGVRHRIPDAIIDHVRELAKTETNLNAISRATGLSHPTVTAIVRGSYWR